MWSELRQAALTVELDERQVAPIVLGAGPCAGLAALGAVVGEILATVVRDRRVLVGWLREDAEVRT